MQTSKQKSGNLGEDIATKYLKSQGFRIIDRNFKCYWGEIDIIAQNGEEIVFIEVKTRKKVKGNLFGDPENAVNKRKIENVKTSAKVFLEEKGILDSANWRIDIISVILNWKDRTARLKHVINYQ